MCRVLVLHLSFFRKKRTNSYEEWKNNNTSNAYSKAQMDKIWFLTIESLNAMCNVTLAAEQMRSINLIHHRHLSDCEIYSQKYECRNLPVNWHCFRSAETFKVHILFNQKTHETMSHSLLNSCVWNKYYFWRIKKI